MNGLGCKDSTTRECRDVPVSVHIRVSLLYLVSRQVTPSTGVLDGARFRHLWYTEGFCEFCLNSLNNMKRRLLLLV